VSFSFSAIRSIQLKIALIAGVCLVVTSVVLIGYSVFSTQTMNRFVTAEVQRGAGETGSASSQVLSSAQSLSADSNRLKLEVGKFLDTVRAA